MLPGTNNVPGGGITLGFHDHGRIADWVYDYG
jgi:hypothetical protein